MNKKHKKIFEEKAFSFERMLWIHIYAYVYMCFSSFPNENWKNIAPAGPMFCFDCNYSLTRIAHSKIECNSIQLNE